MVAKKEKTTERYLQNISKYEDELANEIRSYCKSQVDNWRKIPYLACVTDGIKIWSGGYIDYTLRGYYLLWNQNIHVDLETGKLVKAIYSYDFNTLSVLPVDKENILKYFSSNLEKINTKTIIDYYTDALNISLSSDRKKNVEEIAERRIKKYSLTPIYTRLPVRE